MKRAKLNFDECGKATSIPPVPEEHGGTNLDARRNTISAAFEVEHTTPIYSGLLRFNDVHIDFKLPRAAVVARQERRSVFVRQVNRRTFQASGLSEVCVFYEYADIYNWFLRQQS